PTFQPQFTGTPTSANISCDGPRDVSAPLFTPTSSFAPSGASISRSAPATATLGASVADAAAARPSPTKRTAMVLSGMVAVLLGTTLLVLATRRTPAAVGATAVAVPPPAPAAREEPEFVDLMLRV